MKDLAPAKITILCFLFLSVLYLSSALDFALAVVFISLILLFSFSSVWLFVTAFIFFSLHLIFSFMGLKPNFIGDLTISSYALFVSGLIFYFKEGQKNIWHINFPFIQRISIPRDTLIKFGGILIFVFLLYPLVNVHLAAIIGYISFLVIFRKNDGRYAFTIALFFLVLCPFLLIAKKDKIAESSTIFTYYFLAVGTIQEIINAIKEPKKDEIESVEIEEDEKDIRLSHRERVQTMRLRPETYTIKEVQTTFYRNKRLLIILLTGLLTFLISTTIIYLTVGLKPVIKLPVIKFPKLKINFTLPKKSLSLTPAVPTLSPTPSIPLTELISRETSETAKLKIFVQNGTEIQGLAASTAAKLKEAGLTKIEIGNAPKQDFSDWELSVKDKRESLLVFFKNILDLSEMKFTEATIPAGFDILIIAGKNK